MRYQGRIENWNDERGFGFVVQNSTREKAFVHISAITDRRRRPTVGTLISYELTRDDQGRPKAVNVQFVGSRAGRERNSGASIGAVAFGVIALVALSSVAYVRLSHPNSTVTASAYKITFAQDALRSHPEFRCQPEKSSCSTMTSCAEAFFHQERCNVSNMDGDHDGIPCERQLCN